MSPVPNSSDPWFVQLMKQYGRRLTNLEQSFAGIKDPNGRTRVKFGLLANGDYGIALSDTLGHTQEVLTLVSDYQVGAITATSSTAAPPASGTAPSVDFYVGVCGNFEITCTTNIEVPNNCTGAVWISLDGQTPPPHSVIAASCSNGGSLSVIATGCVQWTDLTGGTLAEPGPHTATLLYSSSSGTANFSGANYLKIQPI